MRGDAKSRAYHTLKHYIKLAWDNANLKWDNDNDTEVMGIVEDIIQAASEERVLKQKGIKCQYCGTTNIYCDREMVDVAKEHRPDCQWAGWMLGKNPAPPAKVVS
jgi:hypothetical protein